MTAPKLGPADALLALWAARDEGYSKWRQRPTPQMVAAAREWRAAEVRDLPPDERVRAWMVLASWAP